MKPKVICLKTKEFLPNDSELKELAKHIEDGYKIVGQSSSGYGPSVHYEPKTLYTLVLER